MNAKLKSEQNAAIMSRYLDKMDADIENLYLEDAALGKCPTEITYLNHPLDPNMNPEVRKSVAASLVGKPVLGIAKGPRRKGSQPQPEKAEMEVSFAPVSISDMEQFFSKAVPSGASTVNFAAPPQNGFKTQENQTRKQIIDEFNSTLAAESERAAIFTKDHLAGIEDCVRNIGKIESSNQYGWIEQYGVIASEAIDANHLHVNFLNSIKQSFQLSIANPKENPQSILEALKTKIPEMEKTRQKIYKGLDALGTSIKNAIPKN